MPFVSEVELFVVKHGLTAIKVFPASEGLFFFCVRRAYENGKRDFCHGSKLIVLRMRVGYLATESSRDTSCCVGSLKNSRITVKERAGGSGFKSHSANILGHAL